MHDKLPRCRLRLLTIIDCQSQRIVIGTHLPSNQVRAMPKELSDSIGQYQFNFAVDDNSALDHICDDLVMARAYKILEERHLHSQGKFLESPDDVKALFQMRHSGLKYETFDVAFLTNRHSLIAVKSLFRGCLLYTSPSPRD